MTEKKDQIQQAADALEALRNAQPAPDQSGPALSQGDEPQAQAKPETRSLVKEIGQAPAADASPRIFIKKLGRIKPRKSRAARKPKAPPPPLTPLERIQRNRQIERRRTAIPLLLTMGLAMIAIGAWSIGVLGTDTDLLHPHASMTPNATYFAKLALLAWPIAVVLLAGAGLFMYDVYVWFTMYPPDRG